MKFSNTLFCRCKYFGRRPIFFLLASLIFSFQLTVQGIHTESNLNTVTCCFLAFSGQEIYILYLLVNGTVRLLYHTVIIKNNPYHHVRGRHSRCSSGFINPLVRKHGSQGCTKKIEDLSYAKYRFGDGI